MLFFFQQKTNEAFATAIKCITVTREQLTNTGVAVPLRRRQTIFLNVFRAYLRKHLTRLHFYRWRSSELLSGSLTNKQRKLFKERGKLCISFMQQRYNHGPQNERPPCPAAASYCLNMHSAFLFPLRPSQNRVGGLAFLLGVL